uniref:Uncharacterized protein n=1 Tax=Arundo donax TaxID=35708 RepID=A0A0A9CDI1_ARUDO
MRTPRMPRLLPEAGGSGGVDGAVGASVNCCRGCGGGDAVV